MAPAGIGVELEGFHAVAAALDAGRVTRLTVEEGRLRRGAYRRLVELAEANGVEVAVVDDVRGAARTGAPQGVTARAHPLRTWSLEEVVAAEETPALLVLDHLEDPRNVGAAVRSAIAAGVRTVVVARRRAAPLQATAFKAAAGTFEHARVVLVSSMADAMRRLGRLGVWRVGLDASAERSLFGFDLLASPVAVAVGAEGRGLSRLVRERMDATVRIPMAGEVESLNASAAAALAVFEVARARAERR